MSFLQGVSMCVSTSVPLGVSSSGWGTVSSLALCQQELGEELVPPWLRRGRMHDVSAEASGLAVRRPLEPAHWAQAAHSLSETGRIREPRPGSWFCLQPALKEVKMGSDYRRFALIYQHITVGEAQACS